MPVVNLQDTINIMNDQASKERAKYHLTLGQLIEKLTPHKGKGLTVPLGRPGSYRGYYTDLSFEPGETPLDAFVATCEECVGKVFEGYKGGDFRMTEDSPLWVAEWGSCGPALMGIYLDGDGRISLTTKELD